MTPEISTQADDHHDAERKVSASEDKDDGGKLRACFVLFEILDKVLARWLAMYWAFGISLLIVGLIYFPFRTFRDRKRYPYSFGKWSLIVLLTSAGATLLLFVMTVFWPK